MRSGMATFLLAGCNQPGDRLQLYPLIQIWPLQNGSPQSNRGRYTVGLHLFTACLIASLLRHPALLDFCFVMSKCSQVLRKVKYHHNL